MKTSSAHEYGGIRFPGFEQERNERMFEVAGYKPTSLEVWPWIDRREQSLNEVLASPEGVTLGIDLEFKENLEPTIVSVTTADKIWAHKWTPWVAERLKTAFLQGPRYHWIAHSGIAADRPVVEKALGIKTPVDIWGDSLISHWLSNMHLCKSPAKSESDDAGSLGFNSLWHMASLTTDAWNWKSCRQGACDGPCPKHDPVGYCGVDSWAGVYGYLEHLKIFEKYKLPYENYRQAVHLSDICYRMECQGIRIDMDYIRKQSEDLDFRKSLLFPENKPFNPKSPKQVVKWFAERGITLKSTDKKDIKKALERQMRIEGVANMEALDNAEQLSAELEALYNTFKFKSSGKGYDSWFADKYRDENDFIHPRFIVPGTSSSRLSSSNPNFTNLPSGRNPMAAARAGVIPRTPETHDITKADVAQLELRVRLWYAGVDQSVIGADAFTWLVENSDGQFANAAKDMGGSPRDVAKQTSHSLDYLLGLKLEAPENISSSRIQDEIRAGARRVYLKKYMPQLKRDWMFMGQVVTFTGAKLAENWFGTKDYAARKKALDIQEGVYYKQFFFLREQQMKVLEFVESHGYVRSATGRFLSLYGTDYEEWAKVACAFLGQGTGAEHVQAMMRRYDKEYGIVPLLQVHDELVFETPKSWSDDYITKTFLRPMVEELDVLPGFRVPVEAKRGQNWKDTRTLGKFFA